MNDKITKIEPGWYVTAEGIHLVKTDAYGDDRGVDWVAVDDAAYARRIYMAYAHGDPRFVVEAWDIRAVHNTLRDLRRMMKG